MSVERAGRLGILNLKEFNCAFLVSGGGKSLKTILGLVISPSNSTISNTHEVGVFSQDNKEGVPSFGKEFNRILRLFVVVCNQILQIAPPPCYGLTTGI